MPHCQKCGAKYDDEDNHCRNCGEEIPKGGGCFIATACYGVNSEEVNIFRNWRDKTLTKSSFGRGFVNTYYKISPSIATFISDKPKLKKIVRLGLYPIKEIVK